MITRLGPTFNQSSLGNEDRLDSKFDAFDDGEALLLNAFVW